MKSKEKKFGDSLGWNKGDVFTGNDREVNRISRFVNKEQQSFRFEMIPIHVF